MLVKKRILFFSLVIYSYSILASVNSIIYCLILAFVTKKWMIYVASIICFLEATYTTVLRSMITKMVTEDEIGKVFCVLEFFKSVESLLCPIIYGKLYEKTVSYVPNAFIFLTIACHILVFIAVVVLNVSMRGKLLGIPFSKRNMERNKARVNSSKYVTNILVHDAEKHDNMTTPNQDLVGAS